MADHEVPVDEGWGAVGAYGGRLALPFLTMRMGRESTDRLTGARATWTSFVAFHVVIGVIAVVGIAASSSTGSWDLQVGAALVAVVGFGATYAGWRRSTRSLECTDGETLANDWYARYLKWWAMVALILPWGVIAGLYTGAAAVTLMAAAIAAGNIVWMAPTRARVATEAERLAAEGCDVDLVAVLRSGGALGGPRPKKRGKGRKRDGEG